MARLDRELNSGSPGLRFNCKSTVNCKMFWHLIGDSDGSAPALVYDLTTNDSGNGSSELFL